MWFVRNPAWRPRIIHGHNTQSLHSTRNLDLECDAPFQLANLTNRAREYILKLKMTVWFIRVPGEKKSFATLLKLDGNDAENKRLMWEASQKKMLY